LVKDEIPKSAAHSFHFFFSNPKISLVTISTEIRRKMKGRRKRGRRK
jgi:hypothetical protein